MHAHTRFLRYGTLFTLLAVLALPAPAPAPAPVGGGWTGVGVCGCRPRPAGSSSVSVAAGDPSAGGPTVASSLLAASAADAADGGVSTDGAAHGRDTSLARTAPLVPATGSSPQPPPRAVGVDYPLFKKTTLGIDVLSRLVDEAPALAPLGGSLAMFDPGDSPYLRRSKADHEGYVITPLPVLWSPAAGVDLLVVTGRGKEGSFVAAWWPLPDGTYRLASTFVMLGEVAPVALAYRPPDRTLEWTTCWRCKGEGGHVAMNDDGTVVIVQD
ncbi:MAG: hypothetical protein ACRENE_09830 [Polyangiaceae bacterium]